MERVTIKSCVKKESTKGTFYAIVLSDDREGISSNDLVSSIGKEIELEIKPAKEYNGVQQYYFNLPKQEGQTGKFPKKDWQLEKRKISLECAINFATSKIPPADSKEVVQVAEFFFKYLNS